MDASIVATNHLGRVVFWMIGALLSFSMMAVSIRNLGGEFSVAEILTFRSGLGLVAICVLMVVRPVLRRDINLRRIGIHAVRNGFHIAGQFLWASGLLLLPLATVFSLEFTTPAWTALLASLFLGERITQSRLGAVLLGVVGVVVILRPGLTSFQPATLLVLAAALCYGVTMITTKKQTATQSTFAIIFWMNAMQLPVAFARSDPLFVAKLGLHDLPWVAGVGVAGLTSHFCLTNAFRAGEASVVAPIDFLRIPLIAVVGWWFYGETVDALVFVGAGIIISGVLWNLRTESRRSRSSALIDITAPLEP